MMEHLRVEGHNNLYRDPQTGSIINKNRTQFEEYVTKRSAKSEENQKIQRLEDDFANIKNDIDEIKSLLRSLSNK
jgi:hypothetical protein|tara:strand:+ start:24259 stop:24483 length:225 start_codon:yes stop_codon:yes gene_type:complete